MKNDSTLMPGFITVERAIELIKEDTREKARVDLQFLVNNIPYMKVKQNYNIRLLKTEEDGRVVRDGTVYVTLYNEYDRQILLRAITDAYNARTGVLVKPDTYGVNHITTVVDEEAQQMTGRPQINATSQIEFGERIESFPEQIIQQGV